MAWNGRWVRGFQVVDLVGGWWFELGASGMARQAPILLDSRVLRAIPESWFPLPRFFFMSVEVVEMRVQRGVVQAPAI